MITVQITPETPSHMLRAIRAACNELLGETTADLTTLAAQHNSRAEELRVASERELDKSAACLTAHIAERQTAASPALAAPYGQGGPVDSSQFYRVGEQPSEQTVLAAAFDKAVQTVDPEIVAAALSTETDSSGTEWNPELHASTKAKNQDGTWKKRRGAGKETDAVQDMGKDPLELSKEQNPQVARDLPPLPPTPPAPATPLVTMNDIYALIPAGKCVLNDVLAAVHSMGFADVGAFSRDATPEQRAQLLAQLTKEVA